MKVLNEYGFARQANHVLGGGETNAPLKETPNIFNPCNSHILRNSSIVSFVVERQEICVVVNANKLAWHC